MSNRQSNRRQTREAAQAFIDNLKPLQHPNSQKLFVQGSRADIQVAMRQIRQTDTRIPTKMAVSNLNLIPPYVFMIVPALFRSQRGYQCAPGP